MFLTFLQECYLLVNDGTSKDRSSYNNTCSTIGSYSIVPQPKKFIYPSYSFKNSALSYSNFAFGTGDFTFECQINNAGAWSSTFDITDGAAGAFCIYCGASTIRIAPQNATSKSLGSISTLTSNTWYHIAIVRSSGTTKSYINGTLLSSVADTNNYAAFTKIGGTADGYFNGYIEDLSFSTFAKYSSNFAPPTKSYQ